jgi:ABC-type nickel/cobalt efflux system permease component RcnA
MSVSVIHELSFLLAIGGVLLVLEAIVTGVAKMTTKLPEWTIKLIAGVLITVTAIWNLLTAPYVGIP